MLKHTGSKKLDSIEELFAVAERLRERGQRIVHCHGVFDLLHIGHIRYLQKAKRLGDVLMVTVTPDRFVNKGPHRPAFNESLRLDGIAALECVDFVAVNAWPTAVEVISRLRPHIYAKGAEFRDRKTPELLREEAAMAECGGTVEFIDDVRSSSSTLINTYVSPFSAEAERYLAATRQRFSAEDVNQALSAARPLKVLVIGEAIIDEYVYCSVIGRSMKSPTIETKYASHAKFAGGALAVANHLAAFCDDVHLLTMLGDRDSEETWIREQLRSNITTTFHRKSNAPTIVKRKYHESYFQSILFAVDYFDDQPMSDAENAAIHSFLRERLGEFDLVVVADYGHQLLAADTVHLLCDASPRLAVSTQADPANFGLHTISRYRRADYVCLSRQDLELECRSRTAEPHVMLDDVARRLHATAAVVTLGSAGCLCRDSSGGFHQAAGLSTRVVDRNGAGEAFFAVSSLCSATDSSPEILAFCGNVAGAQAVACVGNSEPIDSLAFQRHVESLFK